MTNNQRHPTSGTTTLLDSLQCAAERGIVCMTGMVGNSWALRDFSPMGAIPTSVCLTCYSGGNEDFMAVDYDELVRQMEDGRLEIRVGKVFKLEDIVQAHECMEGIRVVGRLLLLLGCR
jgi:NADPH:quinone reductase-like Zn-dependent oxidoreductase